MGTLLKKTQDEIHGQTLQIWGIFKHRLTSNLFNEI